MHNTLIFTCTGLVAKALTVVGILFDLSEDALVPFSEGTVPCFCIKLINSLLPITVPAVEVLVVAEAGC